MSCCEKIIDAAEKTTPCECPAAGYCTRHKIEKVPHFHTLCRTRIDYFGAYERGDGPGQNMPPPGPRPFRLGLGDIAHFIIKVLTFGFVKMCAGCQSRRTRWNRFQLWPIGFFNARK